MTFEEFYDQLPEVRELREIKKEISALYVPLSKRYWECLKCRSICSVECDGYYKPHNFRGEWPYKYDQGWILSVECPRCGATIEREGEGKHPWADEYPRMVRSARLVEDDSARRRALERKEHLVSRRSELIAVIRAKCFAAFPKEAAEHFEERVSREVGD